MYLVLLGIFNDLYNSLYIVISKSLTNNAFLSSGLRLSLFAPYALLNSCQRTITHLCGIPNIWLLGTVLHQHTDDDSSTQIVGWHVSLHPKFMCWVKRGMDGVDPGGTSMPQDPIPLFLNPPFPFSLLGLLSVILLPLYWPQGTPHWCSCFVAFKSKGWDWVVNIRGPGFCHHEQVLRFYGNALLWKCSLLHSQKWGMDVTLHCPISLISCVCLGMSQLKTVQDTSFTDGAQHLNSN